MFKPWTETQHIAEPTILGATVREDLPEDSVDGDFASSAEAESAPRAAAEHYDTDLPDDVLEAARRANFDAACEPENLVER